MNKFKNDWTEKIEKLEAEIENLRQQLDDKDEEMQNTESYLSEKIWEIKQTANREYKRLQADACQKDEEANNRQYCRERIVQDLERAIDWKRITGRDPFNDIERCTQKLRRL